MPTHDVYPPIASYGLIGNCYTAALVNTEGSIDWLCAPRFDSPSVFARILDIHKGGYWSIYPTTEHHANHHYVDNTNVLVTRFLSDEGVVHVHDFMPVWQDPHDNAPTPHALIRIVEGIDGEVEIKSVCAPRPDYGRGKPRLRAQDTYLTFDPCSIKGPSTWLVDDEKGTATCTATIKAGERVAFVLQLNPGDDSSTDIQPDQALDATIDFWQRWSGQCTYEGPYRSEVIRSALALKLLIDGESGAIVAAPTTSLPEQQGGPLNWDYRYTWIRDASFTLYALLLAGFRDETDRFFHWMVDTVRVEKTGIKLMYPISEGERLTEKELDSLEGYQRSSPVRIGNAASGQLQLDIYGEALDALFFAWKAGKYDVAPAWEHFRPLVDWVADHWREADNGIWEVRGERKHYVYSKAMCWVALDRGIKIATWHKLPGDVERWQQERDSVHAQVLEQGWSETLRAFKQSYEDERLDASNLRFSPVGFLKGDDPHITSTIDRTLDRLVTNGLCYRYLGPREGTFLACTFWLISALVLAKRGEEARMLFENVIHYASPLGLYAEEMDPSSRLLLGNFPQALSHIGFINSAVALAEAGIVGKVRPEDAKAAKEARESATHDK